MGDQVPPVSSGSFHDTTNKAGEAAPTIRENIESHRVPSSDAHRYNPPAYAARSATIVSELERFRDVWTAPLIDLGVSQEMRDKFTDCISTTIAKMKSHEPKDGLVAAACTVRSTLDTFHTFLELVREEVGLEPDDGAEGPGPPRSLPVSSETMGAMAKLAAEVDTILDSNDTQPGGGGADNGIPFPPHPEASSEGNRRYVRDEESLVSRSDEAAGKGDTAEWFS